MVIFPLFGFEPKEALIAYRLAAGPTSCKISPKSLTYYLFFFYLTYLLYLAYYTAFRADLCRVPSGFFTTLTGDKFTPALVVCPVRKGGYRSFISILIYSMSSFTTALLFTKPGTYFIRVSYHCSAYDTP